MGIKKTLCALVAAAIIGLTSCSEKPAEEPQRDITISGKPMSVAYTPDTYTKPGTFVGVFEVGSKPLLAYREGTNIRSLPTAKAAAVVQSEMNDGDNEPVKLTGHYRENQFELSSIEANGYKIDF